MADIRIPEMGTGTLAGDSLFETAQKDLSSPTTYASTHVSGNDIAEYVSESKTYAALNTTAKTVVGAINELEAGGGGGGSSTLAGLTDVDITTPTDGQVLSYDSVNQEWVNADVGDASKVELTQAEYDALEQAGEIDPTVMYFITDGQSGNEIIDDNTTSVNKVWSSDKVSSELATKQDDLEGGPLSDVNLNNLVTNMNYWVTRTDIVNAPVDSYGYLEVVRVNTTETAYIVMQRFTRFGNDSAATRGETYLRFFSNNQWYNWFKIAELMT